MKPEGKEPGIMFGNVMVKNTTLAAIIIIVGILAIVAVILTNTGPDYKSNDEFYKGLETGQVELGDTAKLTVTDVQQAPMFGDVIFTDSQYGRIGLYNPEYDAVGHVDVDSVVEINVLNTTDLSQYSYGLNGYLVYYDQEDK